MKEYCAAVYEKMLQELALCNERKVFFEIQIESCFQVANQFWKKIKKRLESYSFIDDEEEIEFFKIVKPMFTSEIEYYTLLYHGELFHPMDSYSAIDFWRRESGRLCLFEREHETFIECYNCHQHKLTPYYFLRRYHVYTAAVTANLYDADTNAITNGDHLVAVLLALRRYGTYAEMKLK